MSETVKFDYRAKEAALNKELEEAVFLEVENYVKISTLLRRIATQNLAIMIGVEEKFRNATSIEKRVEFMEHMQGLRENFPLEEIQEYTEGVEVNVPDHIHNEAEMKLTSLYQSAVKHLENVAQSLEQEQCDCDCGCDAGDEDETKEPIVVKITMKDLVDSLEAKKYKHVQDEVQKAFASDEIAPSTVVINANYSELKTGISVNLPEEPRKRIDEQFESGTTIKLPEHLHKRISDAIKSGATVVNISGL